MSGLIERAAQNTNEYIEKMPKALRKKYGQFFTGKETARYMAELFDIESLPNTISVLDPGAGSGILSIALAERLLSASPERTVDLVCYENDEKVLSLLEKNLECTRDATKGRLRFRIEKTNYITSQAGEYNGWLGAEAQPQKYDLIIGNPPYMKIAKDAPEARAMQDVCYGAPNMYFLFAAMSSFNLKQNGEMVYIIPRSWTSGAYFRCFRQYFLRECSLRRIHLFVSRDKVFENEAVLQETMIIKAVKGKDRPDKICISTTQSSADYSAQTSIQVPYDTVVSGPDNYVYLPTCDQDVEIIRELSKWKYTLPELGLAMKTGLTVDFRSREYLRNEPGEQTVPLFFSQHIQEGKVAFPIGKENEYITMSQPGLLQDNKNYLFVKRFTAKEEHRRLQCGVYLSRKYPQYQKISTQNKINFIGGCRELSDCIVYGLYVLFNSSAYDGYYRILNGSTQVNATEINTMPVPSIEIIEELGKKVISSRDFSEANCDKILRSCSYEENRRSQKNSERTASA